MKDENKALARGLQRRDPDLLDQLIEQYQFRLFRYLCYITGDRTRAEDFFQETWIRVLERGHQYDGKSRFEGWLFTIARNLVIDWQRQRKIQSLDALTDPDQPHPLQVKDERARRRSRPFWAPSRTRRCRTPWRRSAAVYREVLLLRFQEELQIEEIAAVLGAPPSTVKSRLYRGLAALRDFAGAGSVHERKSPSNARSNSLRRNASRASPTPTALACRDILQDCAALRELCAEATAAALRALRTILLDLAGGACGAHAISRGPARAAASPREPHQRACGLRPEFPGPRSGQRTAGLARVCMARRTCRRSQAGMGSGIRIVVGGTGAGRGGSVAGRT